MADLTEMSDREVLEYLVEELDGLRADVEYLKEQSEDMNERISDIALGGEGFERDEA